jgi:hypothetical protein
MKKYLDVAGAKKVSALHTTPLPSDFIPTVDDSSENDEISQRWMIAVKMRKSLKASLIYLGMTWTDILHAVNKRQSSPDMTRKDPFRCIAPSAPIPKR